MNTLPREPMSYKQQIKSDELLTKLRIIRLVKNQRQTKVNVSQVFSCHRNTVRNIIKAFEENLSLHEQKQLLTNSFDKVELLEKMTPVKSKSTRPKSHPSQATPDQELAIASIFREDEIKVGYQRMKRIIGRKYYDSTDPFDLSLSKLSLGKFRGIYKRQGLKVEKIKASSGEYKPLYDYQALACFERMHIDVKYLADKSMLPEDIYYLIKDNQQIPNYQWTIIDAKSRFRFVAYSYNLNAEFGLRLLAFVIQYIRAVTGNWDFEILIGMDNGSEFCSGSTRKEEEWNQYLSPLNAKIYTYHPGHDVRKNLIERSHLDDDYEWLVARGDRLQNKKAFQKEAKEYYNYRNFKRSHSGINMYGRTPAEVIEQSKLLGLKQLFSFPIMILEDHIDILRKATDLLIYQQEKRQLQIKHPELTTDNLKLKDRFELQPRYQFLSDFAQKVLTQDLHKSLGSLVLQFFSVTIQLSFGVGWNSPTGS